MHQLSFDRENEEAWRVYDAEHERSVGEILKLPGGDWIGRIGLDGYVAAMLDDSAERIIAEFEAWMAAGMPIGSPLLKMTEAKRLALISAKITW